jgi:hypothetical protein
MNSKTLLRVQKDSSEKSYFKIQALLNILIMINNRIKLMNFK